MKKEETHYKYTKKRKIACGFLSRKRKSSFVAFIENDDDDEDDNQNLSGSKLILTWSVSTRCYGLTVFENELMIKNPSSLL